MELYFIHIDNYGSWSEWPLVFVGFGRIDVKKYCFLKTLLNLIWLSVTRHHNRRRQSIITLRFLQIIVTAMYEFNSEILQLINTFIKRTLFALQLQYVIKNIYLTFKTGSISSAYFMLIPSSSTSPLVSHFLSLGSVSGLRQARSLGVYFLVSRSLSKETAFSSTEEP